MRPRHVHAVHAAEHVTPRLSRCSRNSITRPLIGLDNPPCRAACIPQVTRRRGREAVHAALPGKRDGRDVGGARGASAKAARLTLARTTSPPRPRLASLEHTAFASESGAPESQHTGYGTAKMPHAAQELLREFRATWYVRRWTPEVVALEQVAVEVQ